MPLSALWAHLRIFRRIANARARLERGERRIAALEAVHGAALTRLAAMESARDAAIGRLAEVERRHDALDVRLAALEGRERAAHARLDGIETRQASEEAAVLAGLDACQRALGEQDRQLTVRTVMDWIGHLPPREAPLVSVVLPTRDRCAILPRAVDSVLAQTHSNWELLVDDASADGTAAVIDGFADPRIRCFRAHGAGVCAARNMALRHARGALIAYLDDDNVMHPEWLKSVVWGFEQRPRAEVLYGAFVVDDTARIDRKGGGDLPRLYHWPYDHQGVASHNIADMGCIAHRAGLPQGHFDESLREMGDWDLFLRLTREVPPLGLPAIACFYTTDAPHRLSNGPSFDADLAFVREKNRR